MTYKNVSFITKTFYGVAFAPNESHDVPGYINDPECIRVDSSTSQEKKTAAKSSKLTEVASVDNKTEAVKEVDTPDGKHNNK